MGEPTTEAGKRLLALVNAQPPVGEVLPEAIAAIEAEARADLAKRIEERLDGLRPFTIPNATDDVIAIVREEADLAALDAQAPQA